ncbi:sensor histidine kinase [Emticicia sp. TH156]|uniref:sensor histidine kinase n=1 Tax=Emticicia sp. TH156 TaxID=2067454 RepID=UPI000C7615E8|nr:sensor histidine kinase [Emticicia sp. TH156]PLK44977.1 hypothetical protein C0V77_06950 [Emticicia sp. TH156]
MVPLDSTFFLSPSKKIRFLQHILFWLLFFGLRLYLTRISFNIYSGFPEMALAFLNISSTGLIALFFYAFTYYVWPKYLLKKKLFKGSLLILIGLVIYTLLDSWTELQILRHCSSCMETLKQVQPKFYALMSTNLNHVFFGRLVTFATPFFLILNLTIPISIKTALQVYRGSVKSMMLSKANLQLEFNFLKAQLNPHFLFNSMNNIYGLIIKKDMERSADLVSRLSGLMRYILYESDEIKMPLSKEIKLLEDYIALEKVRLNFVDIHFEIPANNMGQQIAPLLLIPLLENAFKFTPDEPGAHINIFLSSKENQFIVSISNTISYPNEPDRIGGIGLTNLKKRLELYYPGRYNYEVHVNENNYLVKLTLTLT